MNICLFTENYYKGGLDTFLINLINAWPNLTDKFTLICNENHTGLDTISQKINRPIVIKKYNRIFTRFHLEQGSASGCFRALWGARFISLTYNLLQYPFLFPWYIFTLLLLFWQSNYDRLIVVNGGYPASLLCRTALISWRISGKRPLGVMSFHNSTSVSPWYFKVFENLIDKLVVSSSSSIVSVSKNCLNSLKCRSAFDECRNLFYIFNGIEDPLVISKLDSSVVDFESNTKKYCLMLATYEIRKGHTYLLRAFHEVVKKIPLLQLHVYGHDLSGQKARLKNEIIELKLENNVVLNDFIMHPESVIAGASILVVPSQAYESFGLTIIEAMALCVPVVATDVGGIPEVLQDSCAGLICSKDDPMEFAAAIVKILGDATLASELGRNGRDTFEKKFTSKKMASNYQKLLE